MSQGSLTEAPAEKRRIGRPPSHEYANPEIRKGSVSFNKTRYRRLCEELYKKHCCLDGVHVPRKTAVSDIIDTICSALGFDPGLPSVPDERREYVNEFRNRKAAEKGQSVYNCYTCKYYNNKKIKKQSAQEVHVGKLLE